MTQELIPLSLDKIMQTRTYTIVILSHLEKKFAIYTESIVGKNLQLYLTGQHKLRPQTHDLIQSLFQALEVRVKQVVINDVKDTIYYARLFIEHMDGSIRHIIETDARPSDALTVALLHNAPIFCTRDVLDRAVPVGS